MAEPSKDRDKAVDEAAQVVWPGVSLGHRWSDKLDALHLLWQRAQEAEREENCKAVCERCNPLTRRDPLERVGPAEFREMQWWHFVRIGNYGVWRECFAAPIRNRAARASEEPCKVEGWPEGTSHVCELTRNHEGYHRDGTVRWLGYYKGEGRASEEPKP